MSTTTSKLLWGEGLFLRPQHFQRQDAYHEARLAEAVRSLHPHAWGVQRLEVDTDALATQQLRLRGVQAVPYLVFSSLAGSAADRYSRKHMMLIGAFVQGVLATILTIIMATSSPGPGVIAVYAFANGVVFALAFPAMQAMLPDLVPPGEKPMAMVTVLPR